MKAPLCDIDFSAMVPVFQSSEDPAPGKTTIQCHRCVRPNCKRTYDSKHGYFDWSSPWPPREAPRFVCKKHGSVMILTEAGETEFRYQCPVDRCKEKASYSTQ